MTQTKALKTNFTSTSTPVANVTTKSVTIASTMSLEAGKWVAIAHVRVYTTDYVWDIACATYKTVVAESSIRTLTTEAKYGWTAFSLLCAVLCAAITSAVVYYRDKKVFKYATSSFCIIQMIGATIGALASIPYSDVSASSCMTRPIMPMVAFTLFFIPLVLKAFRVYILFALKSFKRRVIKDSQLLTALLCFLLLDGIIYAIWMSVPNARPAPSLSYVAESDNQYVWECKAEYSDNFYIAVISYKALIVFAALAAAYLTRHVPSLFNESKTAVQCLYILALFIVLGLPLLGLVVANPNTQFAVVCIIISLSSATISCAFFGPKFYVLFTVDEKDLQVFKNSEDAVRKEVAMNRRYSVTGGMDSTYEAPDIEVDAKDTSNSLKDIESGSTIKPRLVSSGQMSHRLVTLLKETLAKTQTIVDRNATGFKIKNEELDDLKEIMIGAMESISKFNKEYDKAMNKTATMVQAVGDEDAIVTSAHIVGNRVTIDEATAIIE